MRRYIFGKQLTRWRSMYEHWTLTLSHRRRSELNCCVLYCHTTIYSPNVHQTEYHMYNTIWHVRKWLSTWPLMKEIDAFRCLAACYSFFFSRAPLCFAVRCVLWAYVCSWIFVVVFRLSHTFSVFLSRVHCINSVILLLFGWAFSNFYSSIHFFGALFSFLTIDLLQLFNLPFWIFPFELNSSRPLLNHRMKSHKYSHGLMIQWLRQNFG